VFLEDVVVFGQFPLELRGLPLIFGALGEMVVDSVLGTVAITILVLVAECMPLEQLMFKLGGSIQFVRVAFIHVVLMSVLDVRDVLRMLMVAI